MQRRFIAVGMGAAVLVGLAIGHVQAQQSLRPASTITVNGQSTSVFSLSLNGGSGPATGAVAYPQSFPAAAPTNRVPPDIQQNQPSLPQTGLLTLTGLTLSGSGTTATLGNFGGGAIILTGAPVTLNGPTLVDVSNGNVGPPAVENYSCATYRPDFRYQANKLGFERETSTSLGQVDMNFWSGLPPGTNRYVPLGEF